MNEADLFMLGLVILAIGFAVVVVIDMAVPNQFCDNTPQKEYCESLDGDVTTNTCLSGIQCSFIESDVIKKCTVIPIGWKDGYALDC